MTSGGRASADHSAERYRHPGGAAVLWAGLLVAPAAWLAQLGFGFALVRRACENQTEWSLNLLSAVTLAAALLGAWIARRSWRDTGEGTETGGGGVEDRSRFLALGGMSFSLFFAGAIVLGWAIALLLSPCAQ